MILMDLLLQAAKVLELGDSDVGAERVTPKSTRGTHFHQYAKPKDENSDNSHDSFFGENEVGTSEEDSSSQHTQRMGGKSSLRSATKRHESQPNRQPYQPLMAAGTREVHNQLEKNRRRQLRECFNILQQCVPSLENKRVATQSILQGAIKHIKNLKKKDVEQEREIQTLANKKCELKKKYDVELNKCSEEQQRLADAFLKVMRAQHVPEEDDGHTSDSTTTASEGPEFSDDDRKSSQPAKCFVSEAKVEGSRKRKLGPRAAISYGSKSLDVATTNQVASTVSQPMPSLNKSSTVSSSSLALKHMLEQRKKNQLSVATQGKSLSQDKVLPTATGTKGQGKPASSLTSSYPNISTRLASGLKSAPPNLTQPLLSAQKHVLSSSELVLATGQPSVSQMTSASQGNQIISQPLQQATEALSMLANTSSLASSAQSLLLKDPPNATQSSSKRRKVADSSSVAHPSSSTVAMAISSTLQPVSTSLLPAVQHNPLSASSPRTAAILNSQPLVQPVQTSSVKVPEVKKLESSQTTVSKILTAPLSTDLQGINYLGKSTVGNNTGTLTMQSLASLAQPVDGALSSKLLSTVIPVSLASFIRSIPINAVVSPVVSLGQTHISMTSASQASNAGTPSSTVTSLFSSPIQQLGTNLIFTTNNKTEVNQQTSVSLSNNNARIATLLAAPSPYLNKNVIDLKPNSSLNLTSNSQHAAVPLSSASTSTITLQDNSLKTMTLTPTLLPLSLSNGQLGTGSGTNLSPAPQLRFFTPFAPNTVMAASLANGQTAMMPTMVQLGNSGQVALLQNLIPTQHVQVQGPRQHHLLSQPIVVMTTPATNFNVTTASGSTSSSTGPSSTNIL
ncbi:chitinase-like protein PB1E7.04c isoform X1 [Biomphalaria glabrata]|nr:chitinase-like protein PB1E7.04c isoform X1 [Biomphalaria glabrata]